MDAYLEASKQGLSDIYSQVSVHSTAALKSKRPPALQLTCAITLCAGTALLNSISKIISTELPVAQDKKSKDFTHSEIYA